MTILFADVADSVGLHDSLGDVAAHRKIVACLDRMSDIIRQHSGRVIETIGDEIMCAFEHPDQALHAACSIQEVLQNNADFDLSVRVGFNHDHTNVDDDHPFGDTVNVASRMVKIAKAGQIIISELAYNELSGACKKQTRHFNRLLLKGKHSACDIHEVLWDRDDSTMKFNRIDDLKYNRYDISQINITYAGTENIVSLYQNKIDMGRGQQCELCVISDVASRLHATVKTIQRKIVITDQSTNGTYIQTHDDSAANNKIDLYLHHDEWIMTGRGTISLGEPVDDNESHLIHFQCLS